MSTPGWYPDPGGRSGHYRYWDGQTWSSTTSAGLPEALASGSPKRPRRGRTRFLIGAGAVVLVVLVVVAALALRPAGRPLVEPVPATTTAPTTAPTTDDPSVTDPSTESTAPGPTSTDVAPPSAVPSATCPLGDPQSRQDHPDDGRVHGGGLSFPRQTGWSYPGRQSSDFTWAYDVGETDVAVEPTWFASYAVGAVSVADGFEDPRSAAELTMRCTLASSFYQGVTSRTDLVSEATTVDGYTAWTLRSEIRADDPRTTFEGDTVQITVVDYDSGEALGFFWGSAPLGADAFTQRLDVVSDQLQVD